jgi:O-antigen ligase
MASPDGRSLALSARLRTRRGASRVKGLHKLIQSARPHLPAEPLVRWASIFFTLCVGTFLISLAASQTFLALAALCYVAHIWRTKSLIRFLPIKVPLAIFCVWTVVSMFFAEEPAAGGFAIRKLVLFVILALTLNTIVSIRHLEFLFQSLFVESALAGALGTVQFIEQYRRMGILHPHRIYRDMMLNRITGFMGHWMNFSGQQMLAFTALATLLLFVWVSRKRRQPSPSFRFTGAAGWMVLALAGLSILLSFTRGVWLGCFVAGLYLLARYFPRWIWALPVLALAGYFVAPHMVRERVNLALHPWRDPALSIRFEMWGVGLKMMERHPLVGVGPNNIFATYPLYLPPGKTPQKGYHDHLHDNFIQFGAERGLPCLAAWVWMMLALGWHMLRIRRRIKTLAASRWIADAAFAGWLAFLIEGFFEFNFGTSPVLMVILFVVSTPFVLENLERAAGNSQRAGA